MGSVAEAVREFDQSVQVPWRPPLTAVPRPLPAHGGVTVLAMPTTRRPRAARVSRLTVPPPLPPLPAAAPAPAPSRPRPAVARVPQGSTAHGHTCAACAAGRRAPALRLTRRARVLLAVLATALAVVLGAWIGSLVDGDGGELVLVSDSSVVVQPGDSVWSIARSVAGDEDVRAVVDEIQELNDLAGSQLQPGQVLRLP